MARNADDFGLQLNRLELEWLMSSYSGIEESVSVWDRLQLLSSYLLRIFFTD